MAAINYEKRWNRIKEILDRVRAEVNIGDEAKDEFRILKRIGDSLSAPCPYCGTTSNKTGNFMISPKDSSRGLNMFTCFICDAKGDAIKLRMCLHREDFVSAGLNLAVKKGIITSQEYDELTSSKFSKNKVQQIQKQYAKEDAEKLQEMSKRAAEEILDAVYKAMIKVCKLKPEHRKYLNEVRELSDEEIDYIGFITMPTGETRFMKELREELSKSDLAKGLEDPLDLLKYVPGFWFWVKAYMTEEGKFRKKVDGKWMDVSGDDRGKWEFVKIEDTIGHPINAANGHTCAIQYRLSPEQALKLGGKYRFFSSTKYANDFATKEEKRIWGASPGSPADVTIPMNLSSWDVIVTEGKFKGYQLAKNTKRISISVQGVASWRPIIQSIKDLRKNVELRKRLMGVEDDKVVYIAFDNDMFYKNEVFAQAEKLATALRKEGFKVNYMSWDKAYKGADDFILANKGKKCYFTINQSEILEKKHELIVQIAKREHGLGKWDRVPPEVMEKYTHLFELSLVDVEVLAKK